MKIIRKSFLNLIYILFILILSLSCSNNDAIEDDKKSMSGLTNSQIEINKLKQQIEILQNQIINKETKTKDIESLLQQANQDLESAENIIIELSKNNPGNNNDSIPPLPPDINPNPIPENTPVPKTETSSKITKIAPAPKISDVITKVKSDAKAKSEADAKAKSEADAKAKSEADAKAKSEADAKAKSEADAKAKAEADAKAELKKTNILIADCKNNYNLANYTEALSKCIELANKNNNYGHRIIALMYLNGYGVNQNISKGNEILFNIANLGDTWSIIYLADKAEKNNDYVNAVKWYEIGDSLDDLHSTYKLGIHYYKGLGVKQDFQLSFSFFKKSADKGHSDSQFYIGKFYHIGNGAYFGSPASKSFFEALKWYELSSAQNNHKAQNNIGLLYYVGDGDSSFRGFKADVKKSLDWFKIAIDNGSESAKKNAELAQSNLYGRDDKRLSEIILD